MNGLSVGPYDFSRYFDKIGLERKSWAWLVFGRVSGAGWPLDGGWLGERVSGRV